MTIYSYFNQKGGVGKTTLAVHHAAHLFNNGAKPLLLDVDRQRHASRWLNSSGLAIHTKYCSPRDLAAELRKQAQAGTEHDLRRELAAHGTVIIDAPGELDVAKPVLLLADVVVLPCIPGVDDLASSIETIAAIERARCKQDGRPVPVVCLNRVDRRTRIGQEAVEALERLDSRGVRTCKSSMPARAAVGRARLAVSIVSQIPSGKLAAQEMNLLLSEIEEHGETITHPSGDSRRAA